VLSDEEVWLFHHNGFVVVPDRIDEPTLARLRAATERNVVEMVEPLELEPLPEGGDAAEWRRPERVRRLSKILHRDAVYLEVAGSAAILDPLEALIGPDIELVLNRHNHLLVRPPGSAPVTWHRQMRGVPYVSVLAYIDGSTPENGAVEVIPGSHRSPFPRPNRFTAEEIAADPLFKHRVMAPVPAGGLLVFWDSLLHSSPANRSAGTRRSMTLAYLPVDELGSADPPNRRCVRGKRSYTGHRGEQN